MAPTAVDGHYLSIASVLLLLLLRCCCLCWAVVCCDAALVASAPGDNDFLC